MVEIMRLAQRLKSVDVDRYSRQRVARVLPGILVEASNEHSSKDEKGDQQEDQ